MMAASDNGSLTSGKLAVRNTELAVWEEQLVVELLRRYREGDSLERVEETLCALRLVRAALGTPIRRRVT